MAELTLTGRTCVFVDVNGGTLGARGEKIWEYIAYRLSDACGTHWEPKDPLPMALQVHRLLRSVSEHQPMALFLDEADL